MCDTHVVMCKLPRENESFFRVQTEWSNTGSFRITIIDHDHVLVGKASSADLLAKSTSLQMEIEQYLKETRNALTTHGGANEFVYSIEDGKFWWKKVTDSKSGMKVKFGSVPVEMVPSTEMIEHMIDTMIEVNCLLETKVQSLENSNKDLETESKELKYKLNQYKSEKKHLEEVLYSKFVKILNAKKQKIIQLEDKIDGILKSNASTTSVEAKSPSQQISKNKRKPALSKRKLTTPRRKGIIFDAEEKKIPNEKVDSLMAVAPSTSKEEDFNSLKQTSTSSTGDQTHYDSETDCDSTTDEELNVSYPRIPSTPTPAKTPRIEVDLPPSTIKLADQESRPVQVCTTAVSTQYSEAVPVKSGREAAREYNTQQLLDELGF